jgi:Bacterial membrane protein YfhO
MKNPMLKKILPHLTAVAIFLVVSVLFCKPVLDGNVLNQGDIIGWKGMAQNAFEYKAKHGHFPLWNPALFSGMPNYQVAMEVKSIIPDNLLKIFSLGMPKPINFFFLACICFYILCLALRSRPVVAIFGALAFAFATYNPVIISAGHETKMLAIAFMPLALAGIIFSFEKRYWLGFTLTTLGAYLEIGVNHPQISFYFFLVAAAVTISYLVMWIRQKEWKHIIIASSITAVAAFTGIAGNALILLTTSEYTKYSIRGGKGITIDGDSVTISKTKGLDTSYAFEYSLGKAEAMVMMMPDAFGGSSGVPPGEKSHVVEKLVSKGIPESQAMQLASDPRQLSRYWGGIGGVGTAGPPYVGVITCLLALIGFVLYKKPLRWGLLAVSVLAILMAWGKYLPGFNTFLFNHLPLYNKFRAPSMTMVITQFTLPIMAVLSLQYLFYRDKSRELLKTDFKKILYAVGGLFALAGIMYIAMDYSYLHDREILSADWDRSGTGEIGRLIVSGLKADRRSMFGGQLLRAIGFAIPVLVLLYLYMRNLVKPIIAVIVIMLISGIDLFVIGKEYLNEDNYVPYESADNNFVPSSADKKILEDKDPDFRVFNMLGNPYTESRTSYFHKSIGGYHPAKLSIYQDVIEKYMSGNLNRGVLNMLNMKYSIQQDPQTGEPVAVNNPDAFGSCWLVKNVKEVENRVEAIKALGTTNLKDTAIVEKSFSKYAVQPQWDSASSINLIKFDNDAIEYKANCNGPQFAVFSEIYYPAGWNAYIDGKKTDYCNVNYILRGLSIPTGEHTIKFVFEPATVKKGRSIMFIASIFIALFFLGGLFMAWKENRKAT